MENVDTKYVCVEINRPTLTYLLQVDKSVNLEDLEEENEVFSEFIDQQFYDDIHDYGVYVNEPSNTFTNFKKGYFRNTTYFLYETDHGGFTFGNVVPPDTKSIIKYNPYKEDGSGIICGKTIKDHIEVYLSSTKEETKELWDKGDIKTLSNYFIYNTWEFYSFSPKQYEPDDTGTLQLIYDEKDNPVEIHLLDVETYQKEEGEGVELLK